MARPQHSIIALHPFRHGAREWMDVWRAAFAVPECLVWFVGHADIHAHRPVHIADSGLDARLHRIVLLAAAKARQMLFLQRQRLVDLASTHRIPAMWNAREFVEIGGLIMYGVSIYDLSRRAAVYVDRITAKAARHTSIHSRAPCRNGCKAIMEC